MNIELDTSVTFVVAGKRRSLTRSEIVSALSGHLPARIFQYWVEIDGKEWPVKQAISIATGLVNTEFDSTLAQKLLKKLGFDVKGGGAKQHRKVGALTQKRGTPTKRVRQLAPPDVVLISYSKTKLGDQARAKELYSSPYFNFMRDYAEGKKKPWFILSAKYGLVNPDQQLEPYDEYLPDKNAADRRQWGAEVVQQLEDALDSLGGKVVEVHAGKAYVAAIERSLRERGANLTEPLKGLGIGHRLAWYRAKKSTPGDVARLVKQLGDESHSISVDKFLKSSEDIFDLPGIYAWWVDTDGAAELSRAFDLEEELNAGLLYAGLAGATRTNGKSSKNTLRKRIATMHLGKRHMFSTLRFSIGSILAEVHGVGFIDEEHLTKWMRKHLQVVAIPFTDVDTLGQIESELLAELDPPLNLSKVSRKVPRRMRLSALRKKFSVKNTRD